MSPFKRRIAALAYLFFSSAGALVLGQEGGVKITINNDTSDSLLVTVYDRGTTPRQQILSSRPIYGNASITVSITADDSGKGHLSWTAMSLERDMRMCGHNDSPDLSDGDTVTVHADGDCSG
jgi:hypothetical protein